MENFIEIKLEDGTHITINLHNIITAKYDSCAQMQYTDAFNEKTLVKYIDGSSDEFWNKDAKKVYNKITKAINL